MLRPREDEQAPQRPATLAFRGPHLVLPSRERLLARLEEETGGSTLGDRLTVVVAPTGYGKTSTMHGWLGDDETSPLPVLWLTCPVYGNATLWELITERLAPFAGELSTTPAGPVHHALLVAAALETSVTLVIDDYHVFTSAENDLALAELASASQRLTIAVIGRRVTVLDGPFVSARTRLRAITERDLRFADDEPELLVSTLAAPRSARLTEALGRADGWPLAIRAALNLGSDAQYLNTPAGRRWVEHPANPPFDPVRNLDEFALSSLALVSADARAVALAASQLCGVSIAQLTGVIGDAARTEAALNELLELGIVEPVPGCASRDYRCHSAVKSALRDYALATGAAAARIKLLQTRAAEIADVAPYAAFQLRCAAGDYADAEVLLANNFNTITDEAVDCLRSLRGIPEYVFAEHPTFAAALLYLENPILSIAPSRLNYVTRLWEAGLNRRLPEGLATPPGEIHLALLCQLMVLHRITGRTASSIEILHFLEGRFSSLGTPAEPVDERRLEPSREALALSGSLPIYFRETASTALAAGDVQRARRMLGRLQRDSEAKQQRPWHGFPHASGRSVTDPVAGTRWRLAALSERIFADVFDGDIRQAIELLADYDEVIASTGEQAPGISWVGAEIARAHLAHEMRKPEFLEQAASRLSALADRLEQWPLLLVTQANSLRETRGNVVALAHLRAGLELSSDLPQMSEVWRGFVVAYEAMLNAMIGDLTAAEALLSLLPPASPKVRLERARLALYASNDVEALLLAQSIGDPGLPKRHRVERRVIAAVAAWNCGNPDEALRILDQAAAHINDFGLPSLLSRVPFEPLRELAEAAAAAGAPGMLALVEEIPEAARSRRYERLTDMELRTLVAIMQHRNANQATASLFITAGTVKKHLAAVYRKLGLSDSDAAILRASRMGLLSLDTDINPIDATS